MALRVQFNDNSVVTFPSFIGSSEFDYMQADANLRRYFTPSASRFASSWSDIESRAISFRSIVNKATKNGSYFAINNNVGQIVLSATAQAKMEEYFGFSVSTMGVVNLTSTLDALLVYEIYSDSLCYFYTSNGAVPQPSSYSGTFYNLDGVQISETERYYQSSGSITDSQLTIRTKSGVEYSAPRRTRYVGVLCLYPYQLYQDSRTMPNYAGPYMEGSFNPNAEKFFDIIFGADNWANVPDSDTPDPYTGAGYPASTAPGGPSGGSFDFTDDPITGVHTPSLDLLNSGLITAWRPSKATLVQLANWLWVTTPGQVIQQLFGNPINAIIGLNIVPVSPPVDGGLNTIKFGNDDSGVACPKITSQHVTVDCGSITVDPIYGSYMDYAPQTSAELFLPYVGGLPLDVNDVVGKTIRVQYEVDVLSGACVAYVFIDGGLHYQKAGSCAATAPITGSQMPNVVAGVLSIAGSVAGFVASAGASGASTAAKVASGIATGTSVAESAANMLKQSISYSGTISGWAGLLGSQKPYLLLSVPHVAMPGGQNALMGYPAWVSGRVGDFTGYTECTVDRVTATRATDKEVEEIKSLLEGGVIL